MNNEFIPYEQALELKELGFDEPCFYQYVRDFDNDGELIPIISETNHPILRDNNQVSLCSGGDCFAAPLYQQAFRWFREKYQLNGLLNHYPNTKKWDCSVHNLNWSGKELMEYIKTEDRVVKYSTYEEAELACLKKLIEIVKNNPHKI
jgi:hypothetical protein